MTQAFQPRAGAPRAGTALGTPSAQRADPRRDRPAGPVVAARAGTRVTRHPAGTPPPRVTAGRPAFPDPGPVLLLKAPPEVHTAAGRAASAAHRASTSPASARLAGLRGRRTDPAGPDRARRAASRPARPG